MADEYVTRYQGLTHQQLWTQLKAGDPGQVDGLAAAWKSLHDTVDSLSTSLNRDLAKLAAGWSSSSGTEYQRRVGLISSYGGTLATEFATMQQELTLMAGELRKAQRQAEDPAATDNNDNLVTDAAIGFAVAGPVGGVVGGLLGHSQDEAEQEKARQRMVQLVAGLAADYGVVADSHWSSITPLPPDEMPGDNTTSSRYQAQSGPSAGTVGQVGATGGGLASQRGASKPDTPSQAPGLGTGAAQDGNTLVGPDGNPIDPVTALAGAGGLAGAGALDAGVLGGAAAVAGAGAGGLGSGALGAGYPLGGAASAAGMGTGSSLGDAGARTPRSAVGSQLTARQSAAGGGRGEGDEPDERMTWLTEDDMVWGADGLAAPPVLGERPAEEPDAAG